MTDVCKYGNEPCGCIKENFYRLLERLKFLCNGTIVKVFMYIASIEKKPLDRSRTSLFAAHFKLNIFFLVHCDDILRGKYTLQKFRYSLIIALELYLEKRCTS